MERQPVVRILHGSHLFGTSTENSDRDFKSVVIPSREEILLGQMDWSSNEGADNTRPNTSFDVDNEVHDLMRFTRMLAAGQPMALEMLFAPREFHAFDPHPVWKRLQENAERIVSKESEKFVGYCRRQALAYGLKGERVEAAEKAVARLEELVTVHGPREKLGPHIDGVIAFVSSPHVDTEVRKLANGRNMNHLRICNRMTAETVSLETALSTGQGVLAEYGRRARAAREASGKDWKALSHALRIGYEAVELFSTGVITLPRPEARRLLAVKLGQADADEVGDEIAGLLEKVESASRMSHLPPLADVSFLEGLVMEAHEDTITAQLGIERHLTA